MDNESLNLLKALQYNNTGGETAISLQGISLERKSEEILHSIDFWINEGDAMGILGPNGGGKTSLLHIILGLLKPNAGQVEVFGEKPAKINHKISPIGYLPESQTITYNFPFTVMDVILSGLYGIKGLWGAITSEDHIHAQYLLSRIKLEECKNVNFHSLSVGEQKLVLFARTLICHPRLLILDDPLKELDPTKKALMIEYLNDIKTQKKATLLITSKDVHFISKLSDKILCLNRTVLWFDKAELFCNDILKKHLYWDIDFKKIPKKPINMPKRKSHKNTYQQPVTEPASLREIQKTFD